MSATPGLHSHMKARAEKVPRASTDRSPAVRRGLLFVLGYARITLMLLAYIDEIGEPGAFVSQNHPRFKTSPAFGYAGFIIPAHKARHFGAAFTREKKIRFSTDIDNAEHPGRWEAKGADLFRPDTPKERPENLRIFSFLVRNVCENSGKLFYYANEKPQGTPKQTALDEVVRERDAMQETLNRIARYSGLCNEEVMVLIDSINEKTRVNRVADMYAHIFGRAAEYPEMKSIIEPPMHLDSVLSSNIQFADWIAAYVTRAINYQLIEDSKYQWISSNESAKGIRGSFTFESKLNLHNRAVSHFYHSEILESSRRIYPGNTGLSIQRRIGATHMRRIKAAAERQHGGGNR